MLWAELMMEAPERLSAQDLVKRKDDIEQTIKEQFQILDSVG